MVCLVMKMKFVAFIIRLKGYSKEFRYRPGDGTTGNHLHWVDEENLGSVKSRIS